MRRSFFLALVVAVGCGDSGPADQAELVIDDGRGAPVAQLELAATYVGQSSSAAVRVTNTGARATGPVALAISGAAANDFALDNERTTCAGAALPPGGSCDVAIVFRPRATGDRRAALGIASEPGGTAQLELIGRSLRPSLVFSPVSLDLGRVQAGHPAQATIELRNEGPAAAPLDAIEVSGPGFSRGVSTCGGVLGPGESCDIAVRLTPQALGPLAGSVVAISDGDGHAAALAAAGVRKISVAIAGSGAGTVTAEPAGIDCGAICEALFDTSAIALTATPGASSVFVGWSIPACGQSPSCAVPAQLEPLAVTASFALDGAGALQVVFAGDAPGEVQIEDLAGGGAPVTCFAGCTVPLQAGATYAITPATPSGFAGIAGACTSITGYCTFTAPVGAATATVTFQKDPKERWTRLPGNYGVGSLAYDSGGNLIVSSGGISKLSPAGATIWTVPTLTYQVAIGPADAIYALRTTLRKLDASGVELWEQQLPAHAQGCAAGAFQRCLAVGTDGSVAVRGATGVARWDAAGALAWSLPVPAGPFAVAIDGDGVVNAAVDAGVFDSIHVMRFTPDGSSLPPLEVYTAQYHAMLAVDSAGRLMASSSGHGSVSLETAAFRFVSDTDDPDWVPTGAAAAGTGDVLWAYQPEELDDPSVAWSAVRYSATGEYRWSLARRGIATMFFGPRGVTPYTLAAGPSGELAVGGRYHGLTYTGSWIQTFAP